MKQQYNRSSYYRANPYYRQGYLPPGAFKNRHHQQFFSQIPTGQNYYDNTGKKHYKNNAYKSQIQSNHVMQSPQKFPFENRIALDKSYFRSLNTIDIQGSTPGTIVSEAVKNKIKAQQQLFRRKNQQMEKRQRQQFYQNNTKAEYKDHPLFNYRNSSFDKSQEQRRRQFALRQFQKNKELHQLLQRKNYHQNQRNQTQRHEQLYQYEQNNKTNQQKNINPSLINQNKLRNYHSQYLPANNHIKFDSHGYPQIANTIRTPVLKNKFMQDQNQDQKNNKINEIARVNYTEDHNQNLNHYGERVNNYQKINNLDQNRNQNQQRKLTQMKKRYQIQNQYQINNNNIKAQNQINHQNKNQQSQQKQYNTIQYPHENSKYMKQASQITLENQYKNTYINNIKKQQTNLNNQQQHFSTEKPQSQLQNIDGLKKVEDQLIKNSNYESRYIHRKMNPTYLSYGSPTIGLAGKNTLGY